MVSAVTVGKKIRGLPNCLHLPYVIAVVDCNDNYSDETDMREYPNDREDNSCEGKKDRTYNAVDKVEAEYENEKYRRENTRPADND